MGIHNQATHAGAQTGSAPGHAGLSDWYTACNYVRFLGGLPRQGHAGTDEIRCGGGARTIKGKLRNGQVGHTPVPPRKRSRLHNKGALVPWFQPMAAHIRPCWAVKQAQAAVSSAVSLVEGRWWTPKRLFQCGMADSRLCELCGAIGHLPHRLASCPAREAFRTAECPKWLSEMAMNRPYDPLFAVGVLARPQAPPPPPWVEHNIGTPLVDGALVTRAVYTYGPLRGLFRAPDTLGGPSWS